MVLPCGGWMKALSMRRGLPFTEYGPSIIFRRRSPVKGSPSCRHAVSTALVGWHLGPMIMQSPGQAPGCEQFPTGRSCYLGPADRFYSRGVHLTPDRSPHALGGRGQLDMFYVESIADRVRHRRECGGSAAFAAAAQPERVGGGGNFTYFCLKEWQLVSPRQRVVHEARRFELPGFGVVGEPLPERLADACGDTAVRLPVQDQRIHRPADVVDRGVAHDLDDAGVGIDLDLAHCAAERIGGQRSSLVVAAGKRRELEKADRAVGTFDLEFSL